MGCWAHARSKFDEAMKSLPKGKAKSSSAAQGLAYCNLLFKIEEALADLSPKERYDQRLKQAKPVLDALLVCCIYRAELATCTGKTCHLAGEFPPPRRRGLPVQKRDHIL